MLTGGLSIVITAAVGVLVVWTIVIPRYSSSGGSDTRTRTKSVPGIHLPPAELLEDISNMPDTARERNTSVEVIDVNNPPSTQAEDVSNAAPGQIPRSKADVSEVETEETEVPTADGGGVNEESNEGEDLRPQAHVPQV
jgi:hypothetical protein